MKLSVKKNKTSFTAVDVWLDDYDYERKDKIYNILLRSPGESCRRVRDNPYNLENWNSPDNDDPMILEFKDSRLGMKFLLQMAEHVERVL